MTCNKCTNSITEGPWLETGYCEGCWRKYYFYGIQDIEKENELSDPNEPTKLYYINRLEIHEQIMVVEATSEEEARAKVADGDGSEVGEPVYQRSYGDPEDWTVTEEGHG
jgi:hypothetical protein